MIKKLIFFVLFFMDFWPALNESKFCWKKLYTAGEFLGLPWLSGFYLEHPGESQHSDSCISERDTNTTAAAAVSVFGSALPLGSKKKTLLSFLRTMLHTASLFFRITRRKRFADKTKIYTRQ